MTKSHESMGKATAYLDAFRDWMNNVWRPDAFATVNLPRERTAPRDPGFYLTLWTRCAEAKVLGPRTLKLSNFDKRIVWLFRREVSSDDLIHYHAVVKFPKNGRWRDDRPDATNTIGARCDRLAAALREASTRTPEPFTPTVGFKPETADIDVRPYDDERNHARYMLKGVRLSAHGQFSSEAFLWDSGLIVLPHLPPKPSINP